MKEGETREAAMDGALLEKTMAVQVQNVKKTKKKNAKTFSWKKFADGVRKNYLEDDGSAIDWVSLGAHALSMFQKAPTGQFMLGALDAGCTVKKKEKVVRQRQGITTEQTQLNDLSKHMDENQRPDNAHETQIGTIKETLEKCSLDGPVELYRFAVNPNTNNPNCFAETMENLFAIAFFVKEGWVEHSIIEGKQYVQSKIYTNDPESRKATELEMKSREKEACIIKFDYLEYNKWCNLLKDAAPMVPDRSGFTA